MAWTAPRTWVTSEIVTAAIMNSHVRDNLLETAPAKAAAAGGIIATSGANSVVNRLIVTDEIQTSETTTSTSYTDLATAGPDLVTLSTGTTALILITAYMANSTAGAKCYAAVDVSGATSSSPSDQRSIRFESSAANDEARIGGAHLYTGLTPGGNTFKLQYRVTAGTGTFANRTIIGLSFS